MDKICEICGKTFEAKTKRARYCPQCLPIAKKMTRAKWEASTDYKTRLREKRKAVRAAEKVRQEEQQVSDAEQRADDRKHRLQELQAECRQELTKQAAEGDLWAAAQLAIMDGDALTYWKCRGQLVQNADELRGHASNNTVGGVSVNDPNFGELVMYDMLNRDNER